MLVQNSAIFSGKSGCILVVSEIYIQGSKHTHPHTHTPLGYCRLLSQLFFFLPEVMVWWNSIALESQEE